MHTGAFAYSSGSNELNLYGYYVHTYLHIVDYLDVTCAQMLVYLTYPTAHELHNPGQL